MAERLPHFSLSRAHCKELPSLHKSSFFKDIQRRLYIYCYRKEMKLKDKPWINNRIQKMMRIRDKILQKLKKQQTPENLKLYKKFRNRVSNELKESKARYFQNYFSTNSQNMKKLWAGIKTIISHKSSTSSSINKIKGKDGNVTSDPSKMPNIFNDFYVNVADGITKTIPLTPKSPLDYLSNRM